MGSGCAVLGDSPATAVNLTPAQHLWQSYVVPLKVAASVYEDTMREAGALHARGQLTDEELERVRKAGHAALLARAPLRANLDHQTHRPPGSELFAAQTTFPNLPAVAEAAGVTQCPARRP